MEICKNWLSRVLLAGRAGTDYPVLGKVPYTNFYCDDQPYPGFFADVETRCQAWHYCDIDGRQATFLCPNGTQFSQAVFVCDWWFNVRCELSPKLYAINSRLYGRPTESPTRPHRLITKELLENIFVRRKWGCWEILLRASWTKDGHWNGIGLVGSVRLILTNEISYRFLNKLDFSSWDFAYRSMRVIFGPFQSFAMIFQRCMYGMYLVDTEIWKI